MTTINSSLPGFTPLAQQPVLREQPGSAPRTNEREATEAPVAVSDQVEAESRPVRTADEVFAALEAGAGAALDGDGARLLALSLRQSLQGQEAAIANTRPNSLLGLLRA